MKLPKPTGLSAHDDMAYLAHLISQKPPVLKKRELITAKKMLLEATVKHLTDRPHVRKEFEDFSPRIAIYGNGKKASVDLTDMATLMAMKFECKDEIENIFYQTLFSCGVAQGTQDLISIKNQISLVEAKK